MQRAAGRSETGKTVVLVLEDEEAIASLLAEELALSGIEVAGPFPSCRRALDWLASATPDCAILDTELRDGSCRDAAAELARRGVPFLVFSGYRQEWNTLQELREAVWVEKPAPVSHLIRTLRKLPAVV